MNISRNLLLLLVNNITPEDIQKYLGSMTGNIGDWNKNKILQSFAYIDLEQALREMREI